MASYEDTRLSFNPALYWRLDRVGPVADGDVIEDISGNGLDGELNLLVGTAGGPGVSPGDGVVPFKYPYGQASPIETDASSWAFAGHNFNVFADTEQSRIFRATDSLIEPSGDFTLDGWLTIPRADMANQSGPVRQKLFGKQDSCEIGVINLNLIGGWCFDTAGTLFYVVSSTPFIIDRSYYVALVRLGNALALYVDAVLIATTTITSGLPTRDLGSDFFIHNAQIAPADCAYDEVAFQLDALGGADIRVIHEAALATLHSSATINVHVRVTLDTDSVEPVDFPFTHNWTDPISGQERVITEHLNWKTLNNRSEPDYQQRIGARPYGPLRQLEYAITPTTPRARTALQRALWQPGQFYRLPIATDWVELAAQANPSDATLDCDTTLRDFEVGSYVTVWKDVYDPASSQTFRVTSVSDTQLGVSPVVATTFPVGSQLMPARLACLPDEESSFDSYAIDLESGALRFEILSTELSTRRVTPYVPVSTHESIEVFSLDSARFDILEQAQYRIQRRQLGTGLLTGNDYYRGVDTISPVTIPARVVIVSRETLSEFYGWLEARQGQRNPVWVASADNDLELVERLSNTSIKTTGYADYNLHYGRRHIQLMYADGSVVNRKITGVVNNGNGTETLTVASLPSGAIVKISLLRLCVAPDSFELRFHRDLAVKGGMVVECAWEFSELLTTP